MKFIIFIFLILATLARADFAPEFSMTGLDGQPVLSVATLAANAKGTKPFTYQWYRNGVKMPGETNEAVTISNPQETGGFYCTLSNSAGLIQTGTYKFANTYQPDAPEVLVVRKQKAKP
jgi:hypothetical protein